MRDKDHYVPCMLLHAPALLLFGVVSPGPLAGVSLFSFYRIVIELSFIVIVIELTKLSYRYLTIVPKLSIRYPTPTTPHLGLLVSYEYESTQVLP